MTVVHYLNQFFAGFGGEEAAGTAPFRLDGPAGPGRGLVAAGLAPDVTIGCGDEEMRRIWSSSALSRGMEAAMNAMGSGARTGTTTIQ